MKSAREIALLALIRHRLEGTWPDLFLKQECRDLPPEEAALASALTYTVIQNRMLLDHYIGAFSSVKPKKMTPQVLDCLRLGAAQLLLMDRIPERAAVNETVALVKKHAFAKAGGFANAVLRKLAAARDDLPQPQGTPEEVLSVRYSHEAWFVRYLLEELGPEGAEACLRANGTALRPTARVNTLKTDRDSLLAELAQAGIAAAAEAVPDAISFDSLRGVLGSEAFQSGKFYIQDLASQLAVLALDPQPGDNMIDMCAAPGGKSLMAVQRMENRGSLVSCDLYPHKVDQLEENASRYGADIMRPALLDASKPHKPFLGHFDRIMCDVPCSGMGIIRKKPDIRYKSREEVLAMPAIQAPILENAASYLKPGGTMVYSTCSVMKQENREQVLAFLERHPEFSLVPFELPVCGWVEEGMITLWPHIHGTDGFFIAKLTKK